MNLLFRTAEFFTTEFCITERDSEFLKCVYHVTKLCVLTLLLVKREHAV